MILNYSAAGADCRNNRLCCSPFALFDRLMYDVTHYIDSLSRARFLFLSQNGSRLAGHPGMSTRKATRKETLRRSCCARSARILALLPEVQGFVKGFYQKHTPSCPGRPHRGIQPHWRAASGSRNVRLEVSPKSWKIRGQGLGTWTKSSSFLAATVEVHYNVDKIWKMNVESTPSLACLSTLPPALKQYFSSALM